MYKWMLAENVTGQEESKHANTYIEIQKHRTLQNQEKTMALERSNSGKRALQPQELT